MSSKMVKSKVLRYSDYVKYNSATLNAFAQIVKIINNKGLYNAELAWYSPRATCLISLYDLERSFEIHAFPSDLTR